MVRRNGTRNAARRKNSNRRSFVALTKRAINRSATGFPIVPPVDPPDFSAGPWWAMTVLFTTKGDTSVTAANIYKSAIEQLSWQNYVDANKNTVPLEIRMQSVRCWGLDKQPIQLAVFDHLGGKHRLKEMSDYGSAINYSRLGWRFGSIAHTDALIKDDNDIIFETSTGKDQSILVYVQVLLRTTNAPKFVLSSLKQVTDDFEMIRV